MGDKGIMTCKGQYKGDRVCEMCNLVNADVYKECYEQQKKSINVYKKAKTCPYRYEEIERYGVSDFCNKKEECLDLNSIRYGKYCCPKLECFKDSVED